MELTNEQKEVIAQMTPEQLKTALGEQKSDDGVIILENAKVAENVQKYVLTVRLKTGEKLDKFKEVARESITDFDLVDYEVEKEVSNEFLEKLASLSIGFIEFKSKVEKYLDEINDLDSENDYGKAFEIIGKMNYELRPASEMIVSAFFGINTGILPDYIVIETAKEVLENNPKIFEFAASNIEIMNFMNKRKK